MLRFVKLGGEQYLGLFVLGLVLFLLQELPYIVMPLIHLSSNPVMTMTEKAPVLNIIEKALMFGCVGVMLLLVRSDAKWFSLSTPKEILCFTVAMVALAGNFIGWGFYYTGHQNLVLIVVLLCAFVPVFYGFIGLWRGNWALAALSAAALIVHPLHVWINLRS
ncbi:MAG: hypothetical protein FWF36_03255 [Propionibacteriaceae bacterium]|nr:hypothetical protein [Propionibacteriaceae bacterium]